MPDAELSSLTFLVLHSAPTNGRLPFGVRHIRPLIMLPKRSGNSMKRRLISTLKRCVFTSIPILLAGVMVTGCEELEDMLAGCDDETKADIINDLNSIADILSEHSERTMGEDSDDSREENNEDDREENNEDDPDDERPEDEDGERDEEDREEEPVEPEDEDTIEFTRRTVEYIRKVCTDLARQDNADRDGTDDERDDEDENREDPDLGDDEDDERAEDDTAWTRQELEELCSTAWGVIEQFQTCDEAETEQEEPERIDNENREP